MVPMGGIQKVLLEDPRVLFAYIYGSSIETEAYRDIDIGVYLCDADFRFEVAADLKLALGLSTGLPADRFDVRALNDAGDLRYLRRVLAGRLLVDKDFDVRGNFLESYSMRYRESEGILDEAFG